LWALEGAKTYDDVIPDGGLRLAAEALDDFRRIGAVNRAVNYP
jgi:hypothetical protein